MGYSSQPGIVVARTQPSKGVLAADIATKGVALKLRSGSLVGSRELLIPDAEIGGGRDIPDAQLGTINFAGDYEMYGRMDGLPTFFKAGLGVAESAVATGVNSHTITPSDGQLPFLSVFEQISSGLERSNYTDVVVNTLHLEAEANGYLMATAGLIGAKQVAGATALDASALYDNSPLSVGTQVAITYAGITLPAKSFSFDLTNNYEDDDYRLGSFYLGDLTAKRREITASVTLRHDDNARMRQALFGTSSATEAGGIATKQPLTITISAADTIVGSTPLTPYSLALTIPKVIFNPFAFEPSGDDILESDVSLQAVRPDLTIPVMTAVFKNGRTEIA